ARWRTSAARSGRDCHDWNAHARVAGEARRDLEHGTLRGHPGWPQLAIRLEHIPMRLVHVRGLAVSGTSPRRGEVGSRLRDPGEGGPSLSSRFVTPHPEWARKARPFRPLPYGER